MGWVRTAMGSILSPLIKPYAFWAVKFKNDKWVSELDVVSDEGHGGKRLLDWTLDLVTTGDVTRIKQLWLFCPPNKRNRFGQTAWHNITEDGTAFQLKISTLEGFGDMMLSRKSILIGKVYNKETGAALAHMWDEDQRQLYVEWATNVYHIGTWRDGILPHGPVSFPVMGLDLK